MPSYKTNAVVTSLDPSPQGAQTVQALAAQFMAPSAPSPAMNVETHMRSARDVVSALMLDQRSSQLVEGSINDWLAGGGMTPFQSPLPLPPRQEAQMNRRMAALVAQNKRQLPFANAPGNPIPPQVQLKPVVRPPSADRLHSQARTQLSEYLAGMGDRQILKGDGDLTPPKAVQAACKRGLDLAPEHGGDGLTDGALSRARAMAAGNAVTADQAQTMAAWFARHQGNRADPNASAPTPGAVAWLLWGGDAGKTWANAKSGGTQKAGGRKLVGGNTGAAEFAESAARGKANPEAYKAAVYGRIAKKAMTMTDKHLQAYLAKGAGDRGGHVIGYTKTGNRPIYASNSAGHGAYYGFSAADHKDAANAHREAGAEHNKAARAARGKDTATVHHSAGMMGHHEFKAKEHDMAAKQMDAGVHRMSHDVEKSRTINGNSDARAVLFDFLSKAETGPGSRGGNVIGKTKSGKPIYAPSGGSRSSKFHEQTAGFTNQDHKDAAKIHLESAGKNPISPSHAAARRHQAVADGMKEKGFDGTSNKGYGVHEKAATEHRTAAAYHRKQAALGGKKNNGLTTHHQAMAAQHLDLMHAHQSIVRVHKD